MRRTACAAAPHLLFALMPAASVSTQELKRGLNALTNFGMSFSIVSFLTSITGSFGIAWFWGASCASRFVREAPLGQSLLFSLPLRCSCCQLATRFVLRCAAVHAGGPVSAVWGWLVASFFTLMVGLAMAEICSSYPTSGGLYYWAARLGGQHRVFASWLAGWFNLLGQVAITAGVGMACTNSIIVMAVMGSSPSRANRHGGLSLATFGTFTANAEGSPGPLLQAEPCPYDINNALVTSYPWPETDAMGGSFGADEVAYNVAECNRKVMNFSQPQVYGIYVGVMTLVAVLNCFSVRLLNRVVVFSILWHVVGSLVLIIGLPSIARTHQPASLIWTFWQPNNVFDSLYGDQAVPDGNTIFQGNALGPFVANPALNWGGNGIIADNLNEKSDSSINAYIFFCGLLMSQWCYTGYDASAHMSEETQDAARAGPFGIVSTIVVTFMFGLAYIVAIIASIVDYNNTTGGPFALSYNPAAQIFWDLHETRYGNGRLCLGMWIIPLMAQFLCTVSSVTSNSRMLYAFARDNAVPGSRIWHVINERVQIPVNAVCGMSVAALLIALPTVQSVEAFGAVTSIATIGLYVSYIIPIVCRLTVGRKEFVPGPFYLGAFSIPIACIATCWVVIICVFFVLPNTFPIDMALNFNCASRVSREADNASLCFDNTSLSYADHTSLVRRRHHRRGRGTGVLVVHLVYSRPEAVQCTHVVLGAKPGWPPA